MIRSDHPGASSPGKPTLRAAAQLLQMATEATDDERTNALCLHVSSMLEKQQDEAIELALNMALDADNEEAYLAIEMCLDVTAFYPVNVLHDQLAEKPLVVIPFGLILNFSLPGEIAQDAERFPAALDVQNAAPLFRKHLNISPRDSVILAPFLYHPGHFATLAPSHLLRHLKAMAQYLTEPYGKTPPLLFEDSSLPEETPPPGSLLLFSRVLIGYFICDQPGARPLMDRLFSPEKEAEVEAIDTLTDDLSALFVPQVEGLGPGTTLLVEPQFSEIRDVYDDSVVSNFHLELMTKFELAAADGVGKGGVDVRVGYEGLADEDTYAVYFYPGGQQAPALTVTVPEAFLAEDLEECADLVAGVLDVPVFLLQPEV